MRTLPSNLRAGPRRLVVGLALAGAVCALAGCGLTAEQEAKQVATQQAQLTTLIDRADGWGAQILAQIPEPEIKTLTDNIGGAYAASDYYEEWPKYYEWNQLVVLHPDGPRTPAQLADDLEPWLEDQGWVRHKEREFPRGEMSFERDYGREGYLLELQVDTVAPPRAQTISFLIVTPETDPHEPAPPTPTPDL